MSNYLLVLIKVSRPQFWVVLPISFIIGLSYGSQGLRYEHFQFTPVILLQLFFLSFPFCLFTFGLNDIADYHSDLKNPRKQGTSPLFATIEGNPFDNSYIFFIQIASFFVGFILFVIAVCTENKSNMFHTFSLILLSFAYSTPPWRLKTRPPLDSVIAGILTVLSPFSMGYCLVDITGNIPIQIYLLSLCAMGCHAFTTIMDYETDKSVGDVTFSVAYGKRTAATFAAASALVISFSLNSPFYKFFAYYCTFLFSICIIYPSEKHARTVCLIIFFSSIFISVFWFTPFLLTALRT